MNYTLHLKQVTVSKPLEQVAQSISSLAWLIQVNPSFYSIDSRPMNCDSDCDQLWRFSLSSSAGSTLLRSTNLVGVACGGVIGGGTRRVIDFCDPSVDFH